MFKRMLASALIAGTAAGLLAALLHFVFVQNLILLGETYETGAAVHFAGGAQHAHSDAVIPAEDHDHAATDHAHGAQSTPLQRNALTVAFTMLIYVSYALILVAGFGAASAFGHRIGGVEGLLWGIAGFAVFQLWPAMGLAPELPGTLAADLGARQLWWWGTAGATALALALAGYVRTPSAAAFAALLLAAPHAIGAPELDGFSGLAPPELAAAFSARVLGVGLVVWATLGWLAGTVWSRQDSA